MGLDAATIGVAPNLSGVTRARIVARSRDPTTNCRWRIATFDGRC